MLVTAMIMEQVGIVGWLSPTNLNLDKTINFSSDQSGSNTSPDCLSVSGKIPINLTEESFRLALPST